MHAVQVQETRLPGVGVRRDLLTESGRRVGVVFHRDGRRELALYDRDDPDACRDSLVLTAEEADTLAELLGAPRIVERLEGLPSPPGPSPRSGRSPPATCWSWRSPGRCSPAWQTRARRGCAAAAVPPTRRPGGPPSRRRRSGPASERAGV
jgi:TrkA domain protein